MGLLRVSLGLAAGTLAAPLALLVGGFIGLSVVNGGPSSPDLGYVAYPLQACPVSDLDCERPTFPPPDYPRNAAGETYGPQRLARSAEELPDLVATRADNGRWGYLRRAEEDAASMQSPAPKRLFVYARDGRTIIGVHEILLPTLDPPADLAQMQAGSTWSSANSESARPPVPPSTSAR